MLDDVVMRPCRRYDSKEEELEDLDEEMEALLPTGRGRARSTPLAWHLPDHVRVHRRAKSFSMSPDLAAQDLSPAQEEALMNRASSPAGQLAPKCSTCLKTRSDCGFHYGSREFICKPCSRKFERRVKKGITSFQPRKGLAASQVEIERRLFQQMNPLLVGKQGKGFHAEARAGWGGVGRATSVASSSPKSSGSAGGLTAQPRPHWQLHSLDAQLPVRLFQFEKRGIPLDDPAELSSAVCLATMKTGRTPLRVSMDMSLVLGGHKQVLPNTGDVEANIAGCNLELRLRTALDRQHVGVAAFAMPIAIGEHTPASLSPQHFHCLSAFGREAGSGLASWFTTVPLEKHTGMFRCRIPDQINSACALVVVVAAWPAAVAHRHLSDIPHLLCFNQLRVFPRNTLRTF